MLCVSFIARLLAFTSTKNFIANFKNCILLGAAKDQQHAPRPRKQQPLKAPLLVVKPATLVVILVET